jgi:2-polyprenyl-3-methyl-5-hydroxy-6-metoxy-1,4-benzoquinol methylase
MSVSELIRVYGKEAFDIVICTEVMEHIFEWQEAVRNMKSILKP